MSKGETVRSEYYSVKVYFHRAEPFSYIWEGPM